MRMFRIAVVIALTATWHVSAAPNDPAASPPNVIIFYADDMGIGDVGAYGCRDIRTPHIDRLAAEGIRFTNYYSAAPVCSPSRAALQTGRYPQRAGVPTNVSSTPGDAGMPAQQFTLGELAKTAGYATGLVGKWHLGFSDDTVPNAQGYDFFFGHHAGCIDYYSHMFYWQAPHHHDLYRNRREIHEEGAYFTELVAREASQFIDRSVAADRPFLLVVPFNAPHYPMQAPQRYLEQYQHLPPQRRDYAALVAGLDDAVGAIMGKLTSHDISAGTLVFFMSDNGPSIESRANFGGGSAAPFRGYKFSLFEGGIRMPGIVRWPDRLPVGATRDEMVIAMDVLPTVADAIGAKLPDGHAIDGRSWWPMMRSEGSGAGRVNDAGPGRTIGHEALFWHSSGQSAVRRGKWKLITNALLQQPGTEKHSRAKGDDAVMLFDLDADPGETTNLHARHREVVRDLETRFEKWKEDVGE